MRYELQLELRSNPLYKKYLREHSAWYKTLIRHPESFKEFQEEMKAAYKLRASDRLDKALDALNFLSNLMSSMV